MLEGEKPALPLHRRRSATTKRPWKERKGWKKTSFNTKWELRWRRGTSCNKKKTAAPKLNLLLQVFNEDQIGLKRRPSRSKRPSMYRGGRKNSVVVCNSWWDQWHLPHGRDGHYSTKKHFPRRNQRPFNQGEMNYALEKSFAFAIMRAINFRTQLR